MRLWYFFQRCIIQEVHEWLAPCLKNIYIKKYKTKSSSDFNIMQYINGYVCYFFYWFHQEMGFCSSAPSCNWELVKKQFFIFNAMDPHRNDHIQNCHQRHHFNVLLNQNNNFPYHIHHDSWTWQANENIDFLVETRKMGEKHHQNLPKCVNAVMSFPKCAFPKWCKEIDWFVESCIFSVRNVQFKFFLIP